jgi:hypothetical protein
VLESNATSLDDGSVNATLAQELYAAIDDTVQRLVDVEEGEAERQAQETTRQAQETTRQEAEANRQKQYINAENARNAQYGASENARNAAYEREEVQRDAAYEQKEAQRQNKEAERQSNEAIRIENENTRNETFARLESLVGDLDVALDDIIAIQESLIEGGITVNVSIPPVTENDEGKILSVEDGEYALKEVAESSVKDYVDEYISSALEGDY